MSGQRNGVTSSVVSTGKIEIRNKDEQKQLTGKSAEETLKELVSNKTLTEAESGMIRKFDISNVQKCVPSNKNQPLLTAKSTVGGWFFKPLESAISDNCLRCV